MEPFLRVCDISYAYHSPLGATPALSGISFTVNKGEFLAIVGPSGCGKSTLLSLLAGLLTPEEGSVYIGDAPLKELRQGSVTCSSGIICLNGVRSVKMLPLVWRSGTGKQRPP